MAKIVWNVVIVPAYCNPILDESDEDTRQRAEELLSLERGDPIILI